MTTKPESLTPFRRWLLQRRLDSLYRRMPTGDYKGATEKRAAMIDEIKRLKDRLY